MQACYIHVPFCKDICAYCDFTRCRYQVTLANKWLLSLCKEINEKLKDTNIDTFYIGGGTPTALSDDQFEVLLQTIHPFSQNIKEYTIEANVDSLTEHKIKIMKHYGVNRISLGVQTLQESLLTMIHRMHTIHDFKHCIKLLNNAAITNISIDLMYGLPNQTSDMWESDLDVVLHELDVTHISLYALTIEEHSEFGRNHIEQMDASMEASMYEIAIEKLEECGFMQYEISNFAKDEKESLHNKIYWNYDDFIGIGCGASGKKHPIRYDNTRNLHTYIQKGPQPEIIELSREDEMFEMIMMSLRLKRGLSLSSFYNKFQTPFTKQYEKPLHNLIKKGMLIEEKDYVKTTYRGMLLLNDVLLEFM